MNPYSTAIGVLDVNDLEISFGTPDAAWAVVRDVSFYVRPGECVALVGESGCGKTLTALSLARLVPRPGWISAGHVRLKDREVTAMAEHELNTLRGSGIAYIFQEPAASLNPVMRIGRQVEEVLRLNRFEGRRDAEVRRLLALVGLTGDCWRAFPHQLSGGQQQRAMIAMALASNPELLVADEPTTALDVSIQAQILDLLDALRRELRMAVLLITHHLGLLAGFADRILVMYAGTLVETGPTHDLLTAPMHPYTRGLLDAILGLEGLSGRIDGIPGAVPNPRALPSGCLFHPRCARCRAPCPSVMPALKTWPPVLPDPDPPTPNPDSPNAERRVRCHYPYSIDDLDEGENHDA